MEFVRLLNGTIVNVNEFESATNKSYPYYQQGKKVALCPACNTSVQIVGGMNNNLQSRNRIIYAAHTKSAIPPFAYDETKKEECVNYHGNANNWQKLYTQTGAKTKNNELELYINQNILNIVSEIESIIGFKCLKKGQSTTRIAEELLNSFYKNKGLYLQSNYFAPEFIPRLILIKAAQVPCWGSIPLSNTKSKLVKHQLLNKFIEQNGQFKPSMETKLVCVLDNDVNPKSIIVKLLYKDSGIEKEIVLRKINANVE